MILHIGFIVLFICCSKSLVADSTTTTSTTTNNSCNSSEIHLATIKNDLFKTTTITLATNLTLSLENFDETASEVDVWLVISLSAISIATIIVFTIMHIVVQIEARDRAKETKKMAFKKLFRNEYLVFSYCFSLFMSHSINMFHKLAIRYHFSQINKLNNHTTTSFSPYSTTTQLMTKSEPDITELTDSFLANTTLINSSNIIFILTTRSTLDTDKLVKDASDRVYCITIGALKLFFWISSMLHSNALSVKIFHKLNKAGTKLNKKNWLYDAAKNFTYIYGTTLVIVCGTIGIQFLNADVYDMKFQDKLSCCFLTQPLFLLTFFALPLIIVLVANFTLYMILFLKTKKTIQESENENMSKLFPKMAVVMGFSWIIYVFSTVIYEVFSNCFYIKVLIVIGSCQINLQGTIVMFGLFSSSVHTKLFKRKKSKKRHQPQPPQPQNQNQNRMTAF